MDYVQRQLRDDQHQVVGHGIGETELELNQIVNSLYTVGCPPFHQS